jgi:alpha-beta hydrolase superfamily lysophospholipase
MKLSFGKLIPLLIPVIAVLLFACADSGGDMGTSQDDIGIEHLGQMEQGKITGCSGQVAYQRWMWVGEAEATLIFLNGRTEYTDKYHRMLEHIDRPWNIIMFDHFGQGRSDGPRAHADDFEAQHVCDLGQVIEQLAPEDVPIVIGSHSMGGLVSARFAELHPGVAKAYVLGSPMFRVPFPYADETVKTLADTAITQGNGTLPAQPKTERVSCEDNVVTHDCDFYYEFKDDPITEIGPPTWGWVSAYFSTRDNLLAEASSITDPWLIFQAGQEVVVVPEAQNELCDKVNENQAGLCRLEVFPNDFHEIFNELDRKAAVEKMIEFFDEVLSN